MVLKVYFVNTSISAKSLLLFYNLSLIVFFTKLRSKGERLAWSIYEYISSLFFQIEGDGLVDYCHYTFCSFKLKTMPLFFHYTF